MALIIRRANVDGFVRDVRVTSGKVAAVESRLAQRQGDEELDAEGGALVPGLHDHHVHLRAWVAARRSVVVGPPTVRDRRELEVALSGAARASDGWIRAVGYHESVAGALDSRILDRLVPNHPLRVQHRSGILWVLNSKALEVVGANRDPSPGIELDSDGAPNGRLWRMDHWLAGRIARSTGPCAVPSAGEGSLRHALGAISREAARRGVTGWTDATPDRDPNETQTLVEAHENGVISQRLHLMTPLGVARSGGEATLGPVKVMMDDARLPPFDQLCELVSSAHRAQRAVAAHCVTRAQLALTVAALEASAAVLEPPPLETDRIEHGADIPEGFISLLARLGLIVITQPNFVHERGDQYLEEVEPDELADLWRGRSLVHGGVRLAAGTDAPFGCPDPWLAVRSSMRRVTASGRPIGAGETLDWKTALALWHGTAIDPSASRAVRVGQPADLVLLAEPLPAALDGDGEVTVRATVIGGVVAFNV